MHPGSALLLTVAANAQPAPLPELTIDAFTKLGHAWTSDANSDFGVIFVGSTQARYHGDTNPAGPEIELNGAESTANGLAISGCGASIHDLAINGFPGNGLLLLGGSGCGGQVSRNYIGTDPAAIRSVPNQRGIWVRTGTNTNGFQWRIDENVIGGNQLSGVFVEAGPVHIARNVIGLTPGLKRPLPNGRSGVGVLPGGSGTDIDDNYISFNGHVGIAIARGAENVAVRGNSFEANGALAIDYGIDDVTQRGGLIDIPRSRTFITRTASRPSRSSRAATWASSRASVSTRTTHRIRAALAKVSTHWAKRRGSASR